MAGTVGVDEDLWRSARPADRRSHARQVTYVALRFDADVALMAEGLWVSVGRSN